MENSGNLELKNELETLHKNVAVEICEENLGFGKAMNRAIKISKTPYVFLNPADIEISNESLNLLNETVKKFSDFGMLSPVYEDNSIHSNYFIWNGEKSSTSVNLSGKDFVLKEVDFIDGTIIINKDIVGENLFDENIFIYFETMDLCKRLIERNIKLYVIDQIKFNHFGGQSHRPKYNHEAHLSRNWHYNWSKFYYNNKHYSYFYAFRKIIPNIIKSIKGYAKNLIFFNLEDSKKNRELYLAEMSGMLASIMKKKSFYRPYKNYKFNK